MPAGLHGRGKTTINSLGAKLKPKFHIDETEEHDFERWYLGTFIVSAVAACLGDLNYSLIVAFFPKTAENKGLDTGEVGMIFAVYQLANFITSFFVPAVTRKFGGRKIMMISSFGQVFILTLMAFTDKIQNKTLFFAVCILLRGLAGTMAALNEIACGGICMRSAPRDQAADASSYLEVCRFIGLALGPVAGGGLFTLGGYSTPFLTSAIIFGCLGVVFIFPMRKAIDNKTDESDDIREQSAQKKMWRSPVVFILFLALFICSVSIAYIEPTIEIFLQGVPFKLNHIQVGGVMSLVSVAFIFFGAASPLFQKTFGAIPMLFLGLSTLGLAYLVVAPPSHFTDILSITAFLFQPSFKGAMALVLLGASLIGAGCGTVLTPVNTILLGEAEFAEIGLEESSDTIVSIMNQSFTLGAFAGGFISGLLKQALGFRKACVLLGLVTLSFTIPAIILMNSILKKRPQTAESSGETSSNSDLSEPFLEGGVRENV